MDNVVLNKYYIYGLASSSNIDLIRYIGYSKDPDNRLANHLRDCSRNKVNTYKKKWITKEIANGNEISLIILDEAANQIEAQNLEVAVIKLYKSVGAKLVNGTLGGDGVICTEAVRDKMRKSGKGRKFSNEHIEKLRNARKGKKLSAETIAKMKETRKGIATRPAWTNAQKLAKSLFIKENPIPTVNNIITPERIEKMRKSKTGMPTKKRKVVLQYSLKNELVKEYPSLTLASSISGINNIHKCIIGTRNHAGGFIWKYK